MSLLMQALKKAERAQQNAGSEELDKPSQAFDEILALTPEPALPPGMSAASTRQEPSLSLEPMAGLSLEPMTPAALAAEAAPASSATAGATPAASDSGLSLSLEPVPASSSASPAAAHVPADAASPTTAQSPATATNPVAADAAVAAAPVPAAIPVVEPIAAAASASTTQKAASETAPRHQPRPAAAPHAGATHAAAQQTSAAHASAPQSAPTPAAPRSEAPESARAKARARAASAASTENAGIDPERLRLFGLIGLLLLVVAGFGYYYWQAVMAPGAGARLPPVPMPPPGATGATPAQFISAPQRAADAPAPTEDAALLPAAPRNGAQRDELERRLTQAEQQLAATQQALQAQMSAPQPQSLPPLAAPESSEIRVARGVRAEPLAAQLGSAYQALNTGELAGARQQYEAVLQQDANNHDALLALASIASREQQPAKAASYYLRLLELDPRDGAAIAGMVGLRQGDPAQNEVRLKGILANNPDAAPVHFALGNLYAQQGRWQDAQQAYFQAYSAAPTNPDYAYNLAIGLDRLNQGKLAQTYYQRALALAQDTAAAFDRNALRKRLQELGASAR